METQSREEKLIKIAAWLMRRSYELHGDSINQSNQITEFMQLILMRTAVVNSLKALDHFSLGRDSLYQEIVLKACEQVDEENMNAD